MIERILGILAPHRCCSCGEKGVVLCESCKENIISDWLSGCVVCRQPCRERGICAVCCQKIPVKQAWCVGERRGALKKLGDAYKFENKRAGAALLAQLLDEMMPILPRDLVVMPIPTSPASVRQRGFDHTGLVARSFAKKRGLKTAQLLERKSSVTLHFMSKSERERYGPMLFRLRPGVTAPKHVLVFDDILTTGTTARAAVKLLLSAGVERVDLAIIARQPKNRTKKQSSSTKN